MKPFTVTITIDRPRDRVLEVYEDRDKLPAWQPGLESFEHVSGQPGHPGAKSRLVYLNGNQRVELIETITKRDLPREYNARFESNIGVNEIQNRFTELDPQRTQWESTVSYEFRGLLMKAMGLLMPGLFRKQNLQFMSYFKALCEDGTDVRRARND